MRDDGFKRTIVAVIATFLIVAGIYGYGVAFNIIDFTGKASSSTGTVNITIADAINPDVVINAPSGNQTSGVVVVNITVTDNGALDTCWYNITDSSNGSLITSALQTITCGSGKTNNVTFIYDGNFTIYAFANDSVANLNNTENKSFQVIANLSNTSQAATSSGASGNSAASSTNFGFSSEFINVDAVAGKTEIIGLEIINLNTFSGYFTVEVEGPLKNAIKLKESEFEIRPGRKKLIEFELITENAGIYTGYFVVKSRGVIKRISYIVRVQSRGAVLRVVDLQILAIDNIVYSGEYTNIEVFLDSGSEELVDAAADYVLKDMEGRIIQTISEFITVKGTKVIHKRLNTVELEPGQYVIEVMIGNKNRISVDAEFLYISEKIVSIEEVSIPKYRVEIIMLLILGLILLFININRVTKHKKKR